MMSSSNKPWQGSKGPISPTLGIATKEGRGADTGLTEAPDTYVGVLLISCFSRHNEFRDARKSVNMVRIEKSEAMRDKAAI